MAVHLIGQIAPGSIDMAFENWSFLSILKVNGYPVLSLIWNVALLLLPLGLMIALERYYQQTKFRTLFQQLVAGFLGLFWLAFIPNAAYIITDVRHLTDPYCKMSFYYRVCNEQAWAIIVFFAYAVVGWFSLVWLVRRMRALLIKAQDRRTGDFFIIGLMPLVSLGVMLGLIERWNSWQILTSPRLIFVSSLSYFSDPVKFKNWLIFTIFLYLLYWAGDKLFVPNLSLRRLGFGNVTKLNNSKNMKKKAVTKIKTKK